MLTHIVLSDLHAGAQNSLLMDRPPDAADPGVSQCFAAAMQSFLTAARSAPDAPRPQLVLLGDLLDLQFSDRSGAMQNAVHFLRGLAQTDLLDPSVLATAGNHDHALWTDARLGLEISAPAPDDQCRATRAYSATPQAQSRMLQAVLARAGFEAQDFRYPNIGLAHAARHVFLHHGHFTEAEYLAITHLIDALRTAPARKHTIADIAAENAGWIDFFWPGIGQTGFSHSASDIYQSLLTPSGFRRISARLTDILASHLGEALPLSGDLKLRQAIRMATRLGLNASLGRFRDSSRYYETAALSPGGRAQLQAYLEGPVADQIIGEAVPKALPEALTFIFGHTHKPFVDRLSVAGYSAPIDVHNIGGWTLNGPRLDNREGASMALIDADRNVAQVRLFSTPQNGVVPPPQVQMLDSPSPGAASFRAEIERWMSASLPQWQALTDAAGAAYLRIQARLLDLTKADIKTGDAP